MQTNHSHGPLGPIGRKANGMMTNSLDPTLVLAEPTCNPPFNPLTLVLAEPNHLLCLILATWLSGFMHE